MDTATVVAIVVVAASLGSLVLAFRWNKQDIASGSEHCCSHEVIEEESLMGQPGHGDLHEKIGAPGVDADFPKTLRRLTEKSAENPDIELMQAAERMKQMSSGEL